MLSKYFWAQMDYLLPMESWSGAFTDFIFLISSSRSSLQIGPTCVSKNNNQFWVVNILEKDYQSMVIQIAIWYQISQKCSFIVSDMSSLL